MTNDPLTAAPATIQQERRDGAVVLRPAGELDEGLADELRLRALEAHAPVVIDLDGCVRLDAAAIRVLTEAWELYRPELCLVCGPVGDRRMLQSCDVARPLPVYASVEEALVACSADGRFRPATTGLPPDDRSAA